MECVCCSAASRQPASALPMVLQKRRRETRTQDSSLVKEEGLAKVNCVLCDGGTWAALRVAVLRKC